MMFYPKHSVHTLACFSGCTELSVWKLSSSVTILDGNLPGYILPFSGVFAAVVEFKILECSA